MKGRKFRLEQVVIPRWTIQRDPVYHHCRRCGSIVVKVRLDSRRISFCICRVMTDDRIPKRVVP